MRKTLILMTGIQGSGKGTQSEMICDLWNFKHICMGDELRLAIKNRTPFGIEYESHYLKGELAPDNVVMGIINDSINDCENFDGIILDGFPRNENQLEWLLKNHTVDVVIKLTIDRDEAIRRLLKRNRSDDNITSIEKRIDDWYASSMIWHKLPIHLRPINIHTYVSKDIIHHTLKNIISQKMCGF